MRAAFSNHSMLSSYVPGDSTVTSQDFLRKRLTSFPGPWDPSEQVIAIVVTERENAQDFYGLLCYLKLSGHHSPNGSPLSKRSLGSFQNKEVCVTRPKSVCVGGYQKGRTKSSYYSGIGIFPMHRTALTLYERLK